MSNIKESSHFRFKVCFADLTKVNVTVYHHLVSIACTMHFNMFKNHLAYMTKTLMELTVSRLYQIRPLLIIEMGQVVLIEAKLKILA